MKAWRKEFRIKHSLDYFSSEEVLAFEGFIERFKKKHAVLMELEPEVGIAHVSQDEDGNPLNIKYLVLGHPFIFDYRLIPDRFEDLKVEATLCEKMPKEFPESTLAYLYGQSELYHSPDRYKSFVNRNLDLIRHRLKSKDRTINEALDALTGGFNQHVKNIETAKETRMIEHKDHITFFNKLLKLTKSAYLQSDVFKNHKKKNWGYSVTATSFEKKQKVIVGFNWGVDKEWVDKGNSYGAQPRYPLTNFASNYKELGSFKRTLPFFYRHFESLPKVQTNYCFFRSETEDQISQKDLELSNELFNELIDYLAPSMLISFSKSLDKYLIGEGRISNLDEHPIQSGNKQFFVTKGSIDISGKSVPYYNLPHPNYPIRGESREEAWKYCFGDLKF